MEIKGKVGEEIYVKATIEKICIDASGTRYYVLLGCKENLQATFAYEEGDIIFEKADVAPVDMTEKAEKVIKKAEKQKASVPGKRRGRPPKASVHQKKATLESLTRKAEAAIDSLEFEG